MNNPRLASLHENLEGCTRIGFSLIPMHDSNDGSCSCQNTECTSRGKHPRVNHIIAKNANKESWTEWVKRWPNMNLGILTGSASGVVVIDIDPRHGGDQELEKLWLEHGSFNTLSVTTGGGGKHYYFKLPEGARIKNSAGKVAPGIDVRADGGLVVAPPSITAAPYVWDCEPSHEAIADLPPWLLKLITAPKPPGQAAPSVALVKPEFLTTSLDVISEGGRNDFLFKEICKLTSSGLVDDALEARAHEINQSRCRPPLPREEVSHILTSARRYKKQDGAEELASAASWGAPLPVKSGLREVPALGTSLLPPVVRKFVEEVAARKSCPPDFPAVGCLIAINSLIGTKAFIRPKKHDTWAVPGGLWGLLIGSPGAMKSPPLNDAISPLEGIERQYANEFMAKKRAYDAKIAAAKKAKVTELLPDPPVHRRAIINDATYETLVIIARDNPQGFLVLRDEFAGVLEALTKDNQREARSFFLTAWSGDSSYATDRVGRGHLRADVVNFSMVGTIQPSVLEHYFRSAIDGGGQDDGLMQRLQLMVYPDPAPYVPYDQPENLEIYSDYKDLLEWLSRYDAAAHGAETLGGKPVFRFDAEAQEIFDQWLTRLESRLRSDDSKLSSGLHGHFSKFRSLLPKLALTLHISGQNSGLISLPTLKRAMALTNYFWKHAKRVYALGESMRYTKASVLASKISDGELKDGFTSTDILGRSWGGLKMAADVKPALGLLCDLGWIHSYPDGSTGGRPATRYLINPKILPR